MSKEEVICCCGHSQAAHHEDACLGCIDDGELDYCHGFFPYVEPNA